MDVTKMITLFNVMKRLFDCEELILKTYTDPCSSVSFALSKNIEDFIKREAERKKVACLFAKAVNLNLSVAQKIPLECLEKVLIHEITHYLLLPQDTSEHPQFFWDEFHNNYEVWKRKRREYDA